MKNKVKCPICGRYVFAEVGDYDICNICCWENDSAQNNDPDYWGGANHLSQNDYKKWWINISTVMPLLIEKYNVKKVMTLATWEFSGLVIPRENVKNFIDEATKNNIELRLDFYNLCKKYNLNRMTFRGFPFIKYNDEIIDIILTKNPIQICQIYNLPQVLKLLKNSKDASKFWEENPPCIGVVSNPEKI